MEFTVRIQSDTHRPISLPTAQIGLDALDRVRRELDMPKLDKSLVKSSIKSLDTDVSFQIRETTARESGLFDEKSQVTVTVPAGFLNNFVVTRVIQKRTPDTGEVTEVWLIRQVQKIGVLNAWVAAGCPEAWDTMEPVAYMEA